MALLEELAGLTPSGPPAPPPQAGTAALAPNLLEALATMPEPSQPLKAPRNVRIKEAVTDFASNFLFSLSEGMKASASAPGGRGTRAGMGAALQGPMVLQQIREARARQQEEDELKRLQFLNTIKTQGVQAAIQQRNAATSELNAQTAAANAAKGPTPQPLPAQIVEYRLYEQQERAAGRTPKTFLEYQKELQAPKSEPQPSASIQEYEFYAAQEKEAGRTPKSFEAWRKEEQSSGGNAYLNALRAIQLEELKTTVPGQVVHAATGNAVRNLPQTAATKISDFQSLLGQADKVKGILDQLGDTNAIKGYVIREGIYVPVVQDNITPQQAEALSEVYRLINAYIYAVSGKQITEQEFARLARTAPSLVYKQGVNDKILANFRDYAQKGLDNYLKVNGWKLAGEEKKPGGGGLIVPGGALEKLIQ